MKMKNVLSPSNLYGNKDRVLVVSIVTFTCLFTITKFLPTEEVGLISKRHQTILVKMLDNVNKLGLSQDPDEGVEDYDEEDPETILGTGYVRSMNGYCLTTNKTDSNMLMALPCSTPRVRFTKFTFTSRLRMKVGDDCVTQHRTKHLYLTPCRTQSIAQIWRPPNEQNFIMSLPDVYHLYGMCLFLFVNRGNGHGEIQAGDCWFKCADNHFVPATWWLVEEPTLEPSAGEVQYLKEQEKVPWNWRFCIELKEHVSKFQKWKQGDVALDRLRNNTKVKYLFQ